MSEKTFTVPNISCGHCVRTVETELKEVPGVQQVTADADSKQVTVTWDEPATWEKIESTLVEINYPPANLVQIN
jgi:copper chaperone